MSRRSQLVLGFFAFLIVLLVAAKLRYPGRAPISLPAASCSADLWLRTYESARLRLIEPCTAVSGRVVSVHPFNTDGDVHIALVPDDRTVLNLMNATHGRRMLIAEIVCDHPPIDPHATSACAGFHSDLAIPKVGDRVRITGA